MKRQISHKIALLNIAKDNHMRKNILLGLMSLSITGCFGFSEKQCNNYATQLKNTNDVVRVFNAYITYKNDRDYKTIERGCWSNFLRRQDINYTCLDEENTSDECILYRRNNKTESEISFFDFNSFLPLDSKIKTEEDFNLVLNYYETNRDDCYEVSEKYTECVGEECDNLVKKTSAEKEACINKIKNDVRMFSKYGMLPCKIKAKKEYQEKLKAESEWYRYAINHDPYQAYRNWVSYTGISAREIQMSMYDPVYSKSDAVEIMRDTIETWGREHLCAVSDWLDELKALGLQL